MKIIVSTKGKKENNRHHCWRGSSGCGGAAGGRAESEALVFSGAFSSGAAIRPLWCGCPGFPKYLKPA